MDLDLIESNIKIWQVVKTYKINNDPIKVIHRCCKRIYLTEFNCWYVDYVYLLNLTLFNNFGLLKKYIKVFGNKLPIDKNYVIWFIRCYNENEEAIKLLVDTFDNKLPIDKFVLQTAHEFNCKEILKIEKKKR